MRCLRQLFSPIGENNCHCGVHLRLTAQLSKSRLSKCGKLFLFCVTTRAPSTATQETSVKHNAGERIGSKAVFSCFRELSSSPLAELGSFHSMRSVFIEKSIGEKDRVAHDGERKVDCGKNPLGPMRHEGVGSGSVECLSNPLDIALHAGIGHPAIHRQQCRATGAKQGEQRQNGFHHSC